MKVLNCSSMLVLISEGNSFARWLGILLASKDPSAFSIMHLKAAHYRFSRNILFLFSGSLWKILKYLMNFYSSLDNSSFFWSFETWINVFFFPVHLWRFVSYSSTACEFNICEMSIFLTWIQLIICQVSQYLRYKVIPTNVFLSRYWQQGKNLLIVLQWINRWISSISESE